MPSQNVVVVVNIFLSLDNVVNAIFDGIHENNILPTIVVECISVSKLACISLGEKKILVFDPRG